ncbi:MAG: DUF4332 domain-containing protein [Anaerolineales bacterium]|jgi:predicted flap endonuclease-1-like 5' DNA nuclease
MPRIIDIEGVGQFYAQKLQAIGIRTTERLLKVAGAKRGRQDLAQQTGISEKLILEWVNLSDLMRIKGVGEEYSDLLEEAGVDSVKELRNRVPANLHQKLLETNKVKKLVRRVPSFKEVRRWVQEAKVIPPVVTH